MSVQLKNPWWVVVGSIIGLLVGNAAIMQFTFGVFLKPISAEFGWDRATASMALSVGLMLPAIGGLIFGPMYDRFGIRKVAIPTITAFALAMIALAMFAHSLVSFIVINAIIGIVAVAQTPMAYTKAITGWFDQRRGIALGLAMMGPGIGGAFIPKFAQSMISSVGWRGAYVGLAVLTFVVAVIANALFVRMPTDKDSAKADVQAAMTGVTATEALRSRRFWCMIIAFFLVVLSAQGSIAHTVPLLTDRGLSPKDAVAIMSLVGFALIGGRLIGGYFLDKIFAPIVASIFFFLPVIGIVLLWNAHSGSMARVAVILIGLGLGAEIDLMAYLISRYLGMRAFGQIYGFMNFFFGLGASLGPYLMGVSFVHAKSYMPCMTCFGIGLIVAIILVLTLGAYVYPPKLRASKPAVAQPVSA